MRTAFFVGILLALIIPLLGSVLVFKRFSMIGHSLSHTALAGVAIGLIAGYNPLWASIIFTIFATLAIELIRKKFPRYAELSIAIVTSAGIGLSGMLSSFVPANNFNSYLFGSIISITSAEVWITAVIFVVVVLFFVLFYKELMFISFNENSAKFSGVPVEFVNIVFSILTAIIVALASKIIGALIVSSILVIPTAIALQVAKSYKSTLLYAVLFSLASVVVGLTLSFYAGLKPGATISLISILFLVVVIAVKETRNKLRKRHVHHALPQSSAPNDLM